MRRNMISSKCLRLDILNMLQSKSKASSIFHFEMISRLTLFQGGKQTEIKTNAIQHWKNGHVYHHGGKIVHMYNVYIHLIISNTRLSRT